MPFFFLNRKRTSSLPEEPPVSMSPSAWPISLCARGGRVGEREETGGTVTELGR